MSQKTSAAVFLCLTFFVSIFATVTYATDVGAAPRTLYYKSNSSTSTKSIKPSVDNEASLKHKQESLISWLQRNNAATASSSIMEQFNEFGPYVSSYVVVRNMAGLPGNNYVHYPADRTSLSEAQQQRDLPIASSGSFPLAVYSYGEPKV